MTTIPSLAFPDLEAPHLDDSMDVASSPYRPDDIDIDLASVREPSIIGSDEMLDDAAIPTGADSDTLPVAQHDLLADEPMFDDTKEEVDEHIDIDYNMESYPVDSQGNEDEDFLYEDGEDPKPVPSYDNETVDVSEDRLPQDHVEVDLVDISDENAPAVQAADHDILRTDDFAGLPANDVNPVDQFTSNPEETLDLEHAQEDQQEMSPHVMEEATNGHGESRTSQHEADEQAEVSQHIATESELIEAHQQPQQHDEDAQKLQQEQVYTDSADLPASTVAESAVQQPGFQPEAGTENAKPANPVHPVTVNYLDEEMSLFPPMLGDASSVYFLPDSSLAFEPLDQLLTACRNILAGTLDHHDELVIDVPTLGLHICEDSKYAAQMTFAQILDVYLQLCHNDPDHEVEPLYCQLSSRVSLAAQYAYLASSAEERKTYTEIAADHLDSPEVEEDASASYSEEGQIEQNDNSTVEDVEQLPNDPGDQQPQIPGADDLALGADAQEDAAEVTETVIDINATNVTDDAPAQTVVHEQKSVIASRQEDLYEQDGSIVTTIDAIEKELVHGAVPDRDDRDSDSSRTLEGDVIDAVHQESTVEFDASDNVDPYELDEPAEDLFQIEDSSLEQQSGYEEEHDQELFAEDDQGTENHVEDDSSVHVAEGAQSSELSEAADDLSSNNVSSLTANKGLLQEPQPPASGNPSPPLTPKGAKRKVEDDDDEFLFLDLDTPDPKRRRPSPT